jgi:hypothetical protein
MKMEYTTVKNKNMALIIEAPKEIYSLKNNRNKKLFLAGGITNCPDWQSEIIKLLEPIDRLTVYNPRRKNFPIEDPKAAEEQITWEYNHLKDADIIVFWFSRGSLNPIVLYELGRWGNSSDKPIIIGLDPEYERSTDVITQTLLSRGTDTPFVHSLEDVVKIVWERMEKD